jgi:hypothetical protein
MRKRGNPNWGKPDVFKTSDPSTFEQVVSRLGLSPHEYESSTALKKWVLMNKDHKYVPQELLNAWRLEVKPRSE